VDARKAEIAVNVNFTTFNLDTLADVEEGSQKLPWLSAMSRQTTGVRLHKSGGKQLKLLGILKQIFSIIVRCTRRQPMSFKINQCLYSADLLVS